MNWIEAKVIFICPNPTIAMDLISDIFYEFGLQGVVIEEPGKTPADDGQTIEHRTDYAVIGYIPKDESADDRCRILESELSRMKDAHNVRSNIVYKETAEKDWAEAWKAFFKPEKISQRMVVKPTWQAYHAKPEEIILEIDPGMAFGTGTHPTTVLCLQMMEDYLVPGNSLLDIGTGSGILLVAAAKLGASRLMGIDKDSMAVGIAKTNLLVNDISSDVFHVQTGHLIEPVKDRYDMVVSNILTETILVLLKHLKSVLSDTGVFIVSGITDDNEARIRDQMESSGFKHLETRHQDNWVAIAGRSIKNHSISNSFQSNQ